MEDEELLCRLQLESVYGIGPRAARALIEAFGSAAAVFRASHHALQGIERVGPTLAQAIREYRDDGRVEREFAFIREHHIEVLVPDQAGYPYLLQQTPDGPSLLFCNGRVPDPAYPCIGIVGTRNNSPRAEGIVRSVLQVLKMHRCTIVSGLAYGTDHLAHKIALEEGMITIAVLGNGLKRMYPHRHGGLAREMIRSGGALLTEHFSDCGPEKVHFPRRNRIVAGLCSAVVVIESGVQGGSMITADLAFQYDREVFAVPGRITDEQSAGCLKLIQQHKANLLFEPAEIAEILNLNSPGQPARQMPLMLDLPDDQLRIWKALQDQSPLHLDAIKAMDLVESEQLSLLLLRMELAGIIKCLPGNNICLC